LGGGERSGEFTSPGPTPFEAPMTTPTVLRSLASAVLLAGTALPSLLFSTHAGHSAQGQGPSEALLRGLPWRAIGPAIMGGRIDDFAVVERRPATFYVATAGGGLFKTTNKGTTWQAVFDDQATSSIGDVTLAPSNPDVVWVGTGEGNNRQSSSWGNGVYRSTDGGKTWRHLGLEATMHIPRIVVDPRNPDVAYVAALGRLWGPNKERGLYKTTDGGKTWTQSLYVDENTGCTDVAMDPGDPETLYAATYQRRRMPFGFNGGGPGSGLYKTTDGGATWTKLSGGLPGGDTGRIGLSIYRKNPQTVYALVENASGGVYRSDDRGESWRKMGTYNPRPMYFSQIAVDPNNDQRVWVLGVELAVSEDGGRTFRQNRAARMHADLHAFWIDPNDSDHILAGCDGGVQWSYDRGETWDFVNNLPLAQFYEVAYDFRRPYWVYGGLQDNGSWGAPSSTTTVRGPTNDEWIQVGGGDGFYAQVDPTDPNILYTESQNGAVGRTNLATGERKSIRPRPPFGEPAYRFDWNTPILISPHDSKKLFLGANRLFISTDRGDSWRRTEDLSTGIKRDKLLIGVAKPGPGVLSPDDGQSTFGQILTVSESPLRPGLIYVGTDDGNLQVSRDDGRTWKNLAGRAPGVPKGTYVSRVVASAHSEGRVYATFDGHRSDDFRPHLFVSEDYGETWRPIAAGIPEGSTLSVVREHPRNPELLFAGAERGIYASFDRGLHWLRFVAPLPMVPVDDIQVHPRENDLILATHGRGVWILDDITPLEKLAGPSAPSSPVLFPPRTAIDWRLLNHKANTGNRFYSAPNAPAGGLVQYYLPAALPSGETVQLAVLEKDGKTLVRELRGLPTSAGWHRVTWDLRHTSGAAGLLVGGAGGGRFGGRGGGAGAGAAVGAGTPPPATGPTGARTGGGTGAQGTRVGGTVTTQAGGAPGGAGGGGGGGGFGGGRGPRVLPGEYLVRLTVGKQEQSQEIVVQDDPRIRISDGDRRALHSTAMRVNSLTQATGDARRRLQEIRTALTTLQGSARVKEGGKPLQDAVSVLLTKVDGLQSRLLATRTGGGGAGGAGTGGAAAGAPGAASSEEESRPAVTQPATPSAPPIGTRLLNLLFSVESITEAPPPAVLAEVDELAAQLRTVIEAVNDLQARDLPALNRQLGSGTKGVKIPAPLPMPR
jgi:photosystem II stability/assembly factor-like uncharacterized protein